MTLETLRSIVLLLRASVSLHYLLTVLPIYRRKWLSSLTWWFCQVSKGWFHSALVCSAMVCGAMLSLHYDFSYGQQQMSKAETEWPRKKPRNLACSLLSLRLILSTFATSSLCEKQQQATSVLKCLFFLVPSLPGLNSNNLSSPL